MQECITYARGRLVELKDKEKELMTFIKDGRQIVSRHLMEGDFNATRSYIDKIELYTDELKIVQVDINVLCKKWGL